MSNAPVRVTILGSGTSHGIPVPGCACPVCRSSDPRDSRTRSSLWINSGDSSVIIDSGPEFRLQTVRERIMRLDAVLITHAHADHLHGLDDVRAYSKNAALPVFAAAWSIDEIHERFSYVFRETPQRGGGKPQISIEPMEAYVPFTVGDLEFLPIEGFHGVIPVIGFRIGDFAYLTDVSMIPVRTYAALHGIKTFVVDGLRFTPHSTHFSIDDAIEASLRVGAERTWITHICHESSHGEIERYCREKTGGAILPAFDGLTFEIGCQ